MTMYKQSLIFQILLGECAEGWSVLVSAIEVKASYTEIFLDSLIKEMIDNVTNFVA